MTHPTQNLNQLNKQQRTELKTLLKQIKKLKPDEMLELIDYLDKTADLLVIFDETHCKVTTNGTTRIYSRTGNDLRDVIMTLFFGIEQHDDNWNAQGIFDFSITHNVKTTPEIERVIVDSADRLNTMAQQITDIFETFKAKIGDNIPSALSSLIKHISEAVLVSIMNRKKFMKVFTTTIAAKILIYCIETGIKYLDLFNMAKNLITKGQECWSSQGLTDFDFSSIQIEKILNIKTLAIPFLFTFLISSFYKIFTSGTPTTELVTATWKTFTKLPKEHSNILNTLKDILNFIGEFFNINVGKNAIKIKCSRLLEDITEMIKIKDNVGGQSRDQDEISYVFERAEKAFSLYENYLELVGECEKWGLKAEVKRLQAIKTQVEQLMKHYLAHAKYLQKDRKVPIFVLMRGEPGCGKTQFLNLLSNFASKLHKPELEDKYRITDIFTPALGSEYNDGYYPGVTSYIFDDLGTVADSVANPDPTFANLINMVNNAPFSLNMSKAEEKGKIFFDSPFIFATTNQEKWNTKSINNAGALARRTYLDILVEPNPDLVHTYIKDGQTCVKLDEAKIDALNVAEGHPPGHYNPKCSTLKVLLCGQLTRQEMSVNDILELLAEEYYRRKWSVNMKESTLNIVKDFEDKLATIEAKYKSQMLEEEEEFHDALEKQTFWNTFTTVTPERHLVNNRYLAMMQKINPDSSYNQAVRMKNLFEVVEVVYNTTKTVANSIMTTFSNLWEKFTWKKTFLASFSLITLGLGYLAYNYWTKEAPRRESQFRLYVVDNEWDWTILDKEKYLDFAKEITLAKNIEKHWGKCYLINSLGAELFDPFVIDVITNYAKYRTHFALGVRRRDMEKLRKIISVMRIAKKFDGFDELSIGDAHDIFSESRVYNDDVNKPRRNIESKTYNPDGNKVRVNIESKTYNPDGNKPKVNIESRVYNDDTNVPKRNIEGLDKSNFLDGLKTLFSQGHIDSTANALLRNRIPQSTGVVAVYDSNERKIGSMHLTMLKGRIGVTASHLLLGKPSFLKVYFVNKQPYEYSISELVFHEDTSRDLLFIEFPNRHEQFKDITKQFVIKSDFKHMTNTKGALYTYPNLADCDLSRSCYKSGNVYAVTTDYVIHTSLKDETAGIVRRLDGLTYDINTDFGECGSCLVMANPMLPRKIAGIHIAGQDASPSGLASVITQEYLEEVFVRCNWKSQVSYQIEKIYNLDSESELSNIIPEAPCHGVSILGKIIDSPRQPTKTSITRSAIHGVFPPETKPVNLRNTPEFDIFRLNSKKISLPTKKIDEKYLRMAVRDVCRTVNIGQDATLVRVFDTETAIAGIPNEKYVDGVKRQTSPGYPYIKAAGGDGKRTWLGYDGDYIIDKDVVDLVDIVIDNAKNLERTPNVFVDSLKDERNVIEKVDAGKTRIFSNGDFIHTIAMRKYTLGFSAHLMRGKIENESAVGIDVHTEWKKLADFLLRDNKTKFVAGDFSGFDGTLNAQILWAILDVIEDFYYNATEEDRRVRYVLFSDLINSIRLQNGVLYQCDHSQPSGNPLTVILNTLYNMIAIRIVYLICKKKASMRPHLSDFRKYVNFVAYGDDNLYGIDDCMIDIFNQHTVTAAFAEIGMVYTDEAKTNDGSVPPYRTFSEVGFLKRTFGKLEIGFRYPNIYLMCPIAQRTIRELCNWTKRSDDNLQATIDNIEDAFHEAFYHGEDFYNGFTEHVSKTFKHYCTINKLRANLKVKSWDELCDEHVERNFPQTGVLM
ncbi:hypothetical protein 1 [Hubei picorna-like virus 25]|uniref:hypothetical protein 1 n=1 Tax=Hubei picorna-like virus 25 TaxID=1923105 RepID=UPI00090C69EA|nr:hypothetical protein 1 [Hubei picorna-like virus 25]APG77992.1 hypothetical protein 1 [Hubei picorna-like virus 25]